MKRAAILCVAVAATTCVACGTHRASDQKLAERLTLQPSDFPSGWTTDHPGSTQIERTNCASAPKVDDAITGYSASADFVLVHPRIRFWAVESTTRVFSSLAAAESWYEWTGGESACFLARDVASAKRDHPVVEVSRLRRVRHTFELDCSSCRDRSSAWRWRFTAANQGGQRHDFVFDLVVVQRSRGVISFLFVSGDRPVGPQAALLVSKVLER